MNQIQEQFSLWSKNAAAYKRIKHNENPQARTEDIVVQELKDETLIYDLKINKAICLNQTSAMIYQFSDGTNSTQEIAVLMSETLKTQVSEAFVRLALDQLKQNDLLAESGKVEVEFGGSSRRQLIRNIGLASLVALPAISSLVAPTAAMAQSRMCTSAGPLIYVSPQPDFETCLAVTFADATTACCTTTRRAISYQVGSCAYDCN